MRVTSVADIISELDRSEVTLLLELTDAVDLLPVQAVMVEGEDAEAEDLRPGTRLLFRHPAATPEPKVSPRVLRALRPYVAAAAMGLPSEDPEGYLVTCTASPKSTVWRVSPL